MRCVILCLSAGATILLLSFRTRSWQEGSCGPVPLRISTGPSERAVGMGRGEAESLEERGREQHRSLAGTEAGCSRPSLPEEKGILGARINFWAPGETNRLGDRWTTRAGIRQSMTLVLIPSTGSVRPGLGWENWLRVLECCAGTKERWPRQWEPQKHRGRNVWRMRYILRGLEQTARGNEAKEGSKDQLVMKARDSLHRWWTVMVGFELERGLWIELANMKICLGMRGEFRWEMENSKGQSGGLRSDSSAGQPQVLWEKWD